MYNGFCYKDYLHIVLDLDIKHYLQKWRRNHFMDTFIDACHCTSIFGGLLLHSWINGFTFVYNIE
jgi:hypothetical protein